MSRATRVWVVPGVYGTLLHWNAPLISWWVWGRETSATQAQAVRSMTSRRGVCEGIDPSLNGVWAVVFFASLRSARRWGLSYPESSVALHLEPL